MIKAVLLDLDNTLLDNPDYQFAGAFLQLLNQYFIDHIGFSDIATQFRHMIKGLGGDRDMISVNTQTAMNHMAMNTGVSASILERTFGEFYASDYDDLRAYSRPVEGSRALIETLLKQNIALVIATNPIYTQAGILRRLEWAGLADFLPDFAFVTHADNMHFAKPNPAYYAEVIARVGVEPDETIMLGDSSRNDILPAQQLGIHTFHLTQDESPAVCRGTLSDFLTVVRTHDWRDHFHPSPFSPAMIVPQYRGNIGALFGLLAQVEPDFWHQHPDPNEWSILQILCHLRNSEATIQRARIQRILSEDNPFLIAPAPPGPNIPVCGEDGYQIAREFVQEREITIHLIEQLSDADWSRPARHSIFGLTTLLEMAHFTAQHDRLHITQLCQTLGKCR